MREWLNGRASPSQGERCEFESRFPLQIHKGEIAMKTIVFQGDSITDANRLYDFDWALGMGYANMVSGMLGKEFPDTFKFLNRGISGNRVVDLYARWKVDCLNLKPDYVSILIGVNDVWHEIGNCNGVSLPRFKDVYRMLLEDTKKALPDTKIMLMSPFVMRFIETENHWDTFRTEVAKRAEVVHELGKEFDLPVICLQDAFDEALTKGSVENWTGDGVHPSAAGHKLIADLWVENFKKDLL